MYYFASFCFAFGLMFFLSLLVEYYTFLPKSTKISVILHEL